MEKLYVQFNLDIYTTEQIDNMLIDFAYRWYDEYDGIIEFDRTDGYADNMEVLKDICSDWDCEFEEVEV